jgi:hypothetical protein
MGQIAGRSKLQAHFAQISRDAVEITEKLAKKNAARLTFSAIDR